MSILHELAKIALFVDPKAWEQFVQGRTPEEARAFLDAAMSSESIREKFNTTAGNQLFFKNKGAYKRYNKIPKDIYELNERLDKFQTKAQEAFKYAPLIYVPPVLWHGVKLVNDIARSQKIRANKPRMTKKEAGEILEKFFASKQKISEETTENLLPFGAAGMGLSGISGAIAGSVLTKNYLARVMESLEPGSPAFEFALKKSRLFGPIVGGSLGLGAGYIIARQLAKAISGKKLRSSIEKKYPDINENILRAGGIMARPVELAGALGSLGGAIVAPGGIDKILYYPTLGGVGFSALAGLFAGSSAKDRAIEEIRRGTNQNRRQGNAD